MCFLMHFCFQWIFRNIYIVIMECCVEINENKLNEFKIKFISAQFGKTSKAFLSTID